MPGMNTRNIQRRMRRPCKKHVWVWIEVNPCGLLKKLQNESLMILNSCCIQSSPLSPLTTSRWPLIFALDFPHNAQGPHVMAREYMIGKWRYSSERVHKKLDPPKILNAGGRIEGERLGPSCSWPEHWQLSAVMKTPSFRSPNQLHKLTAPHPGQ